MSKYRTVSRTFLQPRSVSNRRSRRDRTLYASRPGWGKREGSLVLVKYDGNDLVSDTQRVVLARRSPIPIPYILHMYEMCRSRRHLSIMATCRHVSDRFSPESATSTPREEAYGAS
ncbi:amidase [Anopheles sinensis]|uniref:Amidase n=1 Tax=Anopheles sinensis TaxID=74873 RepID=A0A084WFA3_ANOSI|nr:amidase [Anopheles sinensis]